MYTSSLASSGADGYTGQQGYISKNKYTSTLASSGTKSSKKKIFQNKCIPPPSHPQAPNLPAVPESAQEFPPPSPPPPPRSSPKYSAAPRSRFYPPQPVTYSVDTHTQCMNTHIYIQTHTHVHTQVRIFIHTYGHGYQRRSQFVGRRDQQREPNLLFLAQPPQAREEVRAIWVLFLFCVCVCVCVCVGTQTHTHTHLPAQDTKPGHV